MDTLLSSRGDGPALTCFIRYTSPFSSIWKGIFYFEWVDFVDPGLVTGLVPKIVAYTAEKMKELIRVDVTDRKRATPRLQD